ncbi:hypothetical protein Mgra_00001107 [Meloidogyne graminicola]|uniref:Uncharacterized protein n=1 Tax=Meloidogyne graminicola TaxID=189291 RepID=A0A8T0A1N0_9BILA|nr:hypothetical protein Mgra_00001107 [Meloidogyne graminicola]
MKRRISHILQAIYLTIYNFYFYDYPAKEKGKIERAIRERKRVSKTHLKILNLKSNLISAIRTTTTAPSPTSTLHHQYNNHFHTPNLSLSASFASPVGPPPFRPFNKNQMKQRRVGNF